MFPIEGKLSGLQKEAEERQRRRLEDQLAVLQQKLVNLPLVKEAIAAFDFQNQPISALLDITFAGALANRASDAHFEVEADSIKIRFRIDGQLNDVAAISLEYYKLLLSRIKILSNLKLNVTDRPQDGRFSFHLPDKDVEIRVSVVPSEYGETVVMRLLDPDAIGIKLEDLGLRPDDLLALEEELFAPNGMILNTGPTGSGKTTTLYAFLKKRQTPEIKIITIEDPIEYHLPGIEQTQVFPDGEYSFANSLRSIIRQDPDVILVGEIRDQETAEIATQAALTGHLVFSTVHANEAAGAIPRLLDLGIKNTSIGPALNLVMAQRLVRRLCQQCRRPKDPAPELKISLEKFLASLPAAVDKSGLEIKIFEAVGCPQCNHSGYLGRIGVFELLKIEANIESLIERQASETEIQEFALKQGMITLQGDGLIKALRGITTLEEVEMVTGKLKI